MISQGPEKKSAEPAGLAATASSHYAELKRYLRKRIRRPEDSDDLAHEIIVKCLHMADPRQARNPIAYLKGIAAHMVSDYFRSRRVATLTIDDIERELADICPQLPDQGDHLDHQQQLEHALHLLPPMQAAVLLLFSRDGLTYAEIASKLHLSVHTVHKYLTRARAQLRAMRLEQLTR